MMKPKKYPVNNMHIIRVYYNPDRQQIIPNDPVVRYEICEVQHHIYTYYAFFMLTCNGIERKFLGYVSSNET
jgi:hypothetical protein